MNTYGYVGGNPLSFSDPLGLTFLKDSGLYDWYNPPPMTSDEWDDGSTLDGDRDHPTHRDEGELMKAQCEDVSWAIPGLEAAIAARRKERKDHGGGHPQRNPDEAGHRYKIEALERKLKWLKNCLKETSCPVGIV